MTAGLAVWNCAIQFSCATAIDEAPMPVSVPLMEEDSDPADDEVEVETLSPSLAAQEERSNAAPSPRAVVVRSFIVVPFRV